MDPNAIMNKVMRLARLDTSVFDEVRDDPKEIGPAIILVAISALIAGIGVMLWLLFVKPDGADLDFAGVLLKVLILGTIFAVVLWGVWVAVTYFVLVQVFKEPADIQVLARTMGYAAVPFALSFLMLIPGISLGIGIVALVIWFVMSIYAVQAATGASPDRVIIANLAGFAVFAIIMSFLASVTGMTTGAFVQSDNVFTEGTIFEGEYYE